jgi:hypothetical protein
MGTGGELLFIGVLLAFAAVCFGFVFWLAHRNRKRGAFDASRTLGSPQIAGVMVSDLGWAREQGRAVGAGVSPAAALGDRLLRGAGPSAPATTPPFGAHALLSVTADELALIDLERGRSSPRQREVLRRIPRSDVASAELGQGLNFPLTIRLVGGATWQFEVGWNFRKDAEALIGALRQSSAPG